MSQESSTGHAGHEPSGPTARFERLIAEARLGSEAAIGRLIEECRGFLLAVANRELDSEFRPKIGASDLVQETMLSAQRCIGDFQGGTRDELLAWLRVILVNDIKEARRRYLTAQRDVRREQPMVRPDSAGIDVDVVAGEPTPATDAIVREEAAQLSRAMQRLAPEDREIVEMRNWQRLSFVEIGERLGKSAAAARKMWFRAIMRLQTAMKTHVD